MDVSLGLSKYFYQLVNVVLPVVLAVCIALRNGGWEEVEEVPLSSTLSRGLTK